MSGCHINDAPIALLANHIQKALLEWAGKGGIESGQIVNFCLDCFTLLPFEILTCVIRKVSRFIHALEWCEDFMFIY